MKLSKSLDNTQGITIMTENTSVRSSAAIRNATQRKEAPRERPKGFGGPRLKMAVGGEIPGYHLYWENDDDNGAIEQLLHEGFEFVRPEEVNMKSVTNTVIVGDTDITNRVSRFVGKKEDGTPMRAYLLKCPDDIWAERESDRYALADEKDAAIRQNRMANSYIPSGVKNELDTTFRKEY